MDHTIIKEAATKIVANIKAMEDDITVLRNKQDIISTSDTTMTGSYPGRLSIEEIGGKCEQFTTTGKSLVDFTKGRTSTNGGVTYTLQPDGSFKRTGTATTDTGNVWMMGNWALEPTDDTTLVTLEAGKHYYVVDCVVFSNQAVIYASDNVLYVDPNRYPDGFKVTGIRNDFFEIGKTYNDTIYPLICERSEGMEWEPYTGGQPSPNPDYPQEIKKTVVSGIKTHGKNLVEPCWDSAKTRNGITCTNNGNGSFTLNGECVGTYAAFRIDQTSPEGTDNLKTYNGTYSISLRDENGNAVSNGVSLVLMQYPSYRVYLDSNSNKTNTFDQSGCFIYINVDTGITLNNLTVYPQLEEGSEITEWEPYTESTITLSQPIELYGIGDVQDTIEDGKINKKLTSIVLDGSDDENWTTSSNLDCRYVMTLTNYNAKASGSCLCTCATPGSNNTQVINECYISQYSGFVVNTDFATLDEWKTHLQANPMTVVYELAEPVIEELPLVDQTALNSLKTYDGITYVEIDSEIEPTFKAEYGVTKLGGYTLEGILAGANGVSLGQSNTDRITALEATLVNNI